VNGSPESIERLEYDLHHLMTRHPPVWRHPNKRVIFEVACPPGTTHAGRMVYSRWRALPLPVSVDLATPRPGITERRGFYDYVPVLEPRSGVEWHVNFADPHLFVGYGSSLFAQDEMMVAEHPSLGALREALAADRNSAITVEAGSPTPVLVRGAVRCCAVATNPDAVAGRPQGLYGNRFASATPDVVRRATTRLDPPTLSNIIAMAAPRGGRGAYRREEIVAVLTTAFTGFRAAVVESKRAAGRQARVAVHTGYWGCGAFGGNRALMVLLQAVSARMAGVDLLVMHTADAGGIEPFAVAMRHLDNVAQSGSLPTDALVGRILEIGFAWGVGDGT
jgi:Poly (ADP-ribose) glycohydrolase (PARG), Macro domain fold